MKHSKITITTVEDVYICERCSHESGYKGFTAVCPKHGEYCSNCCNKKESRFPFMICPECKISWKEAIESGKIVGPNLILENINLPTPFIIIKENGGYWIGSKKK